jgi:hypothetical protein
MSRLKYLIEILSIRPCLTRSDLMIRYQRDEDTIDRWHREGVLPRAVYLPGCISPLWRPTDIYENENQDRKLRSLAKASGAKSLK